MERKFPNQEVEATFQMEYFVLSAKAMLCYVLEIPMDYYGLFRAFAIGQ